MGIDEELHVACGEQSGTGWACETRRGGGSRVV